MMSVGISGKKSFATIGTGLTILSESNTNTSARVISGRPRKQTAPIPVVAGRICDNELLC